MLLELEDGRLITVGGECEVSEPAGPDRQLVIPELPDILRALGESHEDAITAGPPADPDYGWLE